jgi:hypothetical protein
MLCLSFQEGKLRFNRKVTAKVKALRQNSVPGQSNIGIRIGDFMGEIDHAPSGPYVVGDEQSGTKVPFY